VDQRSDNGGVLLGVKKGWSKVCVGMGVGALEAVVGKRGVADAEAGKSQALLGTQDAAGLSGKCQLVT